MFPQSASEQNLTLQLSQLFSAQKERVFRAWTNKEALEKWFGPEGMTMSVLDLEFAVGGQYRFKIGEVGGNQTDVFGKYLEIVPNEKLVFTWRWEDWESGMSDSLVTVEFSEKGAFTEVQVTHSQLADEQQIEAHKFGWTSTLAANLKNYLAGEEL